MKVFWSYSVMVTVVLVACAVVRLWDPSPVARLRLLAFDTFQKISPRRVDPAYPVRIIDIDETSIAALGEWPWSREKLAQLVARLSELGARVVAFDMVFPSVGRDSLRDLPDELRRAPAVAALLDKLDANTAGDQRFADSLKGRPVVLGVIGRTGQQVRPVTAKASFALLGSGHNTFLPTFDAATGNLELLQTAATGIGALNWFPEHDQVVRKVPMLIRAGRQLLPSLAAETYRLHAGGTTIAVRSSSAGGEAGFGGNTGITSVRVGQSQIPTDKNGQVWVSFSPHDPERFRSAARVMGGQVPKADIEGRIVLIGSSAPGLFDLRATPLDSVIAGVEVHAQALEQFLTGKVLFRPDYSTGLEIAIIMLAGFVLAYAVRRAGALTGIAIGALIVSLVAGGAWYAFLYARVLFDPVYPTLSLTAAYIFASGFAYINSERQRVQIRRAFGQYLAPSLVERLTQEPWRLRLGGETRELSIMFSDVQGFTTIAEGFRDNPGGLTRLMNRLLSPLTESIITRQGTVDKYIGDAIMAFWNAPLDDAEHPRKACEAALEMQRHIVALNRERESQGEATVPMRLRIGIATGPGVVGNMGSDLRFDYSVLGDTVNLASRLEGMCREYSVGILIGDVTCARGAGHLAVLEVDVVRVLGRQQAERVWAIVGGTELAQDARFVDFQGRFSQALAAYRSCDWATARSNFESISAEAEGYDLAGLIDRFLERIAEFEVVPPAADWQGIWTADRK